MIVSAGLVVKLKSSHVHKRSPKTIKLKGRNKKFWACPCRLQVWLLLMKGIRLFYLIHAIIESTIKRLFTFFKLFFLVTTLSLSDLKKQNKQYNTIYIEYQFVGFQFTQQRKNSISTSQFT